MRGLLFCSEGWAPAREPVPPTGYGRLSQEVHPENRVHHYFGAAGFDGTHRSPRQSLARPPRDDNPEKHPHLVIARTQDDAAPRPQRGSALGVQSHTPLFRPSTLNYSAPPEILAQQHT